MEHSGLQEEVIGWLREALEPFRDRYTPILLMDAAPVHVASNVLRACVERSIHVIVVPAQMTWLLQPLDTHAFRLYKAYLCELSKQQRPRTDTRHLTVAAFLQVVYCTIRQVLQRSHMAPLIRSLRLNSGTDTCQWVSCV